MRPFENVLQPTQDFPPVREHFFIALDGLDPETGLSTPDVLEAQNKRIDDSRIQGSVGGCRRNQVRTKACP
jgi:hypothetical protein